MKSVQYDLKIMSFLTPANPWFPWIGLALWITIFLIYPSLRLFMTMRRDAWEAYRREGR